MSFEENLISIVKEHEYLYNTKSRSYRNANKRAVAWDAISKSLNRPVQDCRQRWRSLRDRFSREHRSVTSRPSGSGAVDVDEKWELYDSLQFLIPSLITRKQIGNTPNIIIEDNENSPEKADKSSTPTPKSVCAAKRKAVEETFQTFMDDLNATVVNLNRTTVEVDADIEFMTAMAKKMKPLPTCQNTGKYK